MEWRSDMQNAPKDRNIMLAGQWLSGEWDVQIGQWLVNRFPFVGQGQPTRWAEVPTPKE
jgi:hypothetical protein